MERLAHAIVVSICPVQKGECAMVRGVFHDGFSSAVRAHARSSSLMLINVNFSTDDYRLKQKTFSFVKTANPFVQQFLKLMEAAKFSIPNQRRRRKAPYRDFPT